MRYAILKARLDINETNLCTARIEFLLLDNLHNVLENGLQTDGQLNNKMLLQTYFRDLDVHVYDWAKTTFSRYVVTITISVYNYMGGVRGDYWIAREDGH